MKTAAVLETTKCVIQSPQYVTIDCQRLAELCRQWAKQPFVTPPWDTSVHYTSPDPEQLANYILVLDCLNFCFWPDPGEKPWTIEYRGQTYGGYQALAASLKRAVEDGLPLTRADWLENADMLEVAKIFQGQAQIPLIEKRLENINEVGQVLRQEFDGSFSTAVRECQQCAPKLACLMADYFKSFCDTPEWHGQTIRILKRAQITVVDLYGSFGGRGLGEFKDIGNLTAFADYKIPQVLRALGVLQYCPSLAAKVDNYQLLPAGSDEEIEIRVSMIWAIEYICQELAKLGHPRAPYELDWFLWNLGQQVLPGQAPYHRTRTIYY